MRKRFPFPTPGVLFGLLLPLPSPLSSRLCSSGSACSKGQRSHTLTAMGLTDQEVDGGIRVSFCSGSKDEDLDALLEGLREAGKTLMRAYR